MTTNSVHDINIIIPHTLLNLDLTLPRRSLSDLSFSQGDPESVRERTVGFEVSVEKVFVREDYVGPWKGAYRLAISWASSGWLEPVERDRRVGWR